MVALLEAQIECMQYPSRAPAQGLMARLLRRTTIEQTVLIENLALDVNEGEVLSLVGPNGAGKTTLLRILAGLEPRYAGQVRLNGSPVAGPGRRIQVLFQDGQLLPWLTVRKNVEFARNANGANNGHKGLSTTDPLTTVGLAHKARSLPRELSGGETSRAALARCFVDPPEVLLMDEPFRALDALSKYSIQDSMLQFARDAGTTIVLVSHSVDDAVCLSDRVLVLHADPLRVHRSVPIEVPRPRQRGDPQLGRIAATITELLRASGEE